MKKKPSAAVELEKKLTDSLKSIWPSVFVNVFRIDENYFAADVVDESFTGSWLPHHRKIHDKLEKDGLINNGLCSLCPVTPEDFENRVEREDDYEET